MARTAVSDALPGRGTRGDDAASCAAGACALAGGCPAHTTPSAASAAMTALDALFMETSRNNGMTLTFCSASNLPGCLCGHSSRSPSELSLRCARSATHWLAVPYPARDERARHDQAGGGADPLRSVASRSHDGGRKLGTVLVTQLGALAIPSRSRRAIGTEADRLDGGQIGWIVPFCLRQRPRVRCPNRQPAHTTGALPLCLPNSASGRHATATTRSPPGRGGAARRLPGVVPAQAGSWSGGTQRQTPRPSAPAGERRPDRR